MKLAAHPLVVAVALGVLPAHALAESEVAEPRDRDTERPCTDCREPEAAAADDDPAIDALLDALRDLPSEGV